MKLYPYANLKFKTSLSKEELLLRLKVIVEPVKKVRLPLSTPEKPYEGKVNEDDYSMMLLAKYARKSLAPIKGKIEQDVGGYVVNAIVRLNIFGYLVLLFALIIFLGILYSVLLHPLLMDNMASEAVQFALSTVLYFTFFLIVFYVMYMIPFLRLYNRVKKDFCTILKTEEVEDLGIRGGRRQEYE